MILDVYCLCCIVLRCCLLSPQLWSGRQAELVASVDAVMMFAEANPDVCGVTLTHTRTLIRASTCKHTLTHTLTCTHSTHHTRKHAHVAHLTTAHAHHLSLSPPRPHPHTSTTQATLDVAEVFQLLRDYQSKCELTMPSFSNNEPTPTWSFMFGERDNGIHVYMCVYVCVFVKKKG